MNQPFEATCSDLENLVHVFSMKNVKVMFSNKCNLRQKLNHRPVIIKVIRIEKWARGGNS